MGRAGWLTEKPTYMPLSDLKIAKARAEAKPYKLFDGGGLFLHVMPHGAKLWRLAYRRDGKQTVASFGAYPGVSLAQARAKREAAKGNISAGRAPTKVTSTGSTFRDFANEVLARSELIDAPITHYKKKLILLTHAVDLLDRPVAEITPADLLEILHRMEADGRLETASRLRALASTVFRRAMLKGAAKADPTTALRGEIKPPTQRPRAALVSEKEVGVLLGKIEEYSGWPTVRLALKFLYLTMARPGEVRLSTWAEIDLDSARWSIPAERMKMRRPHEVPLSRQALEVLTEAKRFRRGGEFVFASATTGKPLSEAAMLSAIRRMGFDKNQMSAHGFRSVASTALHERGYDTLLIESALAHLDENKVRRTYNRSGYWDARVKLMQQWADITDGLRDAK